LVFSPDGTILAGVRTKARITGQPGITKTLVSTTRREIQLWDVNTGNELSIVIPQQVKDQRRGPFVTFSLDGKTFATAANEDVAAVQL
jgi:WD40 repeat protein